MQHEPTFKGNESSCICEKPKGRHKKHCDAYRLSEFLLKASLPMQNEPQKYVDTICSMRRGSADEKQFRATVEHNIATALEEQMQELAVTENTSDGYHTFKELYEFRKLYNAALFNEWAGRGVYRVHKSMRHSDGELCFGGGWFIVVATLPTGQISNHYELKDWGLFKCKDQEKAETWDGHTEKDVIERLQALLTQQEKAK